MREAYSRVGNALELQRNCYSSSAPASCRSWRGRVNALATKLDRIVELCLQSQSVCIIGSLYASTCWDISTLLNKRDTMRVLIGQQRETQYLRHTQSLIEERNNRGYNTSNTPDNKS